MKKKMFLASAMFACALLSSTVGYSADKTVKGKAKTTKIGDHSYNLDCLGSNGVCYTETGNETIINHPSGPIVCSFPVPPVLVPNGDGTYTQVGSAVIETFEEIPE